MEYELHLHEEIMLLALRDREGTIDLGVNYQCAIGGAILAELLMTGRIAVEQLKKKKMVNVVNKEKLFDPLIDECLEKMKSDKRRATLQTWVSRFAGVKNMKHRVAKQLCRLDILREDEDRVMLIFKRKIYPELNPAPEKRLIEKLQNAIFTDTETINPKTMVLISLAKSTDLLKIIFDKKELKNRKERIEMIINGELAGKATKEAIQAMQAAVMVAVFVPTIVAVTGN
ncbi:MAG TPA: GPP34 family phosphoprotein [Bacteroidetes bacterium]|nr:GPP34 family phosphoprotein [Bacteroidota bacterium]